MITFDELKQRALDKSLEGLVNITSTFSAPKNILNGENSSFSFKNITLTEVYVLFDEKKVDELISKAKEDNYFASCSKTYKEAKVNKDGEIIKDAYWKIRITYKDIDY